MYVTCFLPKSFNVVDKEGFIQSIDLFKDDYIIFSNVYQQIYNHINDPKNKNKQETHFRVKVNISKIKVCQKIILSFSVIPSKVNFICVLPL